MPLPDAEVYARIGEDGFARLLAGFYRRVRTDEVLGPLYPPDDWEGAEVRLRDFLIFRFGGPERYIEARGHPRLRMRHMPFAVGPVQRDRWLKLMDEALVEAQLDADAAEVLAKYFLQTAEAMRNRQ